MAMLLWTRSSMVREENPQPLFIRKWTLFTYEMEEDDGEMVGSFVFIHTPLIWVTKRTTDGTVDCLGFLNEKYIVFTVFFSFFSGKLFLCLKIWHLKYFFIAAFEDVKREMENQVKNVNEYLWAKEGGTVAYLSKISTFVRSSAYYT